MQGEQDDATSRNEEWRARWRGIRSQTLGDMLRRTRARYPDKLAFVAGEERLTWLAFDERVNRAARALAAAGVGHGTVAAMLSRNSLDFAVVNFALARIGAILVPINYMLSAGEIAYILQHCQAQALLAPPALAPLLQQAADAAGCGQAGCKLLLETGADALVDGRYPEWASLHALLDNCVADEFLSLADDRDVAQILYTSGTESRPKGVMLTHGALLAEYTSMIVASQVQPDDITVHALPLYHSAQLHAFLGPFVYVGGTAVILPAATPLAILEAIEREQATLLFAPPTVWISLLRQPEFDQRDLSSLRQCVYGAAIMPVEVQRELRRRLPAVGLYNMYGQTEVAPLATTLSPADHERKPGSVGRATLNVEAAIFDDADQPVSAGVLGEIVLRTAHAMLGYLHDEGKTAEAFRNGWFHTGDLGVMDEEGYITVVDRKKDMIKTGGVNVASSEVEEVLYQHPAVSEVAVIGVPDPYWIEAVTAIVVLRPGTAPSEAELLAHCRDRLAGFKAPKRVVMVANLPKNPSGKVLKRELRTQYGAAL